MGFQPGFWERAEAPQSLQTSLLCQEPTRPRGWSRSRSGPSASSPPGRVPALPRPPTPTPTSPGWWRRTCRRPCERLGRLVGVYALETLSHVEIQPGMISLYLGELSIKHGGAAWEPPSLLASHPLKSPAGVTEAQISLIKQSKTNLPPWPFLEWKSL